MEKVMTKKIYPTRNIEKQRTKFFPVLLMLIGMCLGMNAGYAINPARDFGPRMLTLCVGYGWRVFS